MFDTLFHCCSHSQMFSYHHRTYFCSTTSQYINSIHKKAYRSSLYLLTSNRYNSSWCWDRTEDGEVSFIFFIHQMFQHTGLVDFAILIFWKITLLLLWLTNCFSLSKVLLGKGIEKLLPNATFWDFLIHFSIISGIFCK